MACFVVPLAEAVVVSGAKVVLSHYSDSQMKISLLKDKLGTLQKMLFGGSFLLAIEHYVNGEISFVPPFLTAMNSPEETSVMLHEMATSGVMMAVLVTAAWTLMMVASHFLKKSSVLKNLKSTVQRKKSVFASFMTLVCLSTLSSALMWSVDFVSEGENGVLMFGSLLLFGIFAGISGLIHNKLVLSSEK